MLPTHYKNGTQSVNNNHDDDETFIPLYIRTFY